MICIILELYFSDLSDNKLLYTHSKNAELFIG